jgi:Multiubiquitin
MSSENANEHLKPLLKFILDGREYEWPDQYITANELRELGKISGERELLLKIREPWSDELIDDNAKVDLARPGIEHFFSREKPSKVAIIVNGREKDWPKMEISFKEVVELAFGANAGSANTVFTVTYKNGPEKNPQGVMVAGDSVFVKTKMIFNVTATDKS